MHGRVLLIRLCYFINKQLSREECAVCKKYNQGGLYNGKL